MTAPRPNAASPQGGRSRVDVVRALSAPRRRPTSPAADQLPAARASPRPGWPEGHGDRTQTRAARGVLVAGWYRA